MGQTVKLRRSAVSGRVPNNSQLQLGELSMNTTDGKIFLAKSGSEGPSIEEVIITNTQNTGSLDIVGSISGSFLTGSFIGDGSGLYNIPASGVTGLSLDKISSGASTASIDANGLQINVNTSITGSLTATEFTGSGLGLTNVPINVSGSDANLITYDGQFTQFLFDDSTGIKVSGDTSTGTAKIYLDGVAAENDGGIGVTAKLEVTGATSTWTFDHGLGEQYPAITVFDSDGYVIIPQNIEAVSSTQLVITFSSPQTGVATATIGGGLPAISSSYGGRLLTVNSDGTFAEWKESIYLQTGSFETYTSSVNDRFNSIETFTSSIDETYATDEDVTDLRNDLNLYTSSTDDRLDSLETASGSLNSFTSSINTTIKTKLNTETVVSGSEQVVSLLSNQDVDLGTGDITAVTGSFGQLSIDDTIRATNFTGSFLRLDQNGAGLRMTNVGAFDNDGSNNFRIFSTNDLIIATGGDSGTAITIDSSTKDATFQGNIVLSGTVDGVDVSELKTNYDTSTGSHDGRLDSLETTTGSLDGRLDTIETTFSTSVNQRLFNVESSTEDNADNFMSYTSSTDDRLDSLETTSGSHNTRIGNLETFETKVDNGLEFTGSNVTIKGNLLVKGTETRVDSTTVDLSDNIISLNGSGASNAGIEVRDTTSPGLLSGSLIWDSTNNYWLGGTKSNEERLLTNTDLTNLDGRLDSLETDSGSIRSDFNSYTSSNDNNINGIDGRLGSLESFTSSIDDTYATDQDITDLRGDFNTYTSSNDTTNTTQNSRLTSLESATGSYTTTDYFTTGATFNQINGVVTGTRNDGGTWTVDLDGRYLTGYTESDPIFSASPSANIADSDIENWNTAYGWGDHTQAGYLTSYNNEYTTGATFNQLNGVVTFTRNDGDTFTVDLDGRYLTSHPNVVAATSSNNSGRTYIQDILLDSNGHVTGLTTSTETVVNTDEYTTGVTWNGTTAVLTFTRNDGDTYSVTMLETLSDVTVTGGTYNSGTQTLRLTKSDGSTVDVSGFAVDTDTNWYTTGATFNNANGILTIVGKGMSDVTVDLDGRYLTSYNDEYTTGATFNQLNGVVTFTRNDGDTFTVDLDGRYLTGYTETDPIFSASPSANIADSDIENWNLAHGWGDHSQVGYLTSYSETDTLQSVTSRGSTTTNTVTVGSSTHRGGTLQVNDYNSNTDGMRIYGYSNNEILSLISRYDQADGGLFFKRGNNGSESTIGEINWVSNQFRINAQVGSLAVMTGGFTALSIDSNQVVSLSSGLNITAGNIDMGTNTITDTKIGQWDTAYGWGDHSQAGYLTSYNNEYVTGATFNTGNGIITFTRNDGDTFTVDIDGKYAESGHNHDSAYVNVGGDTMTGTLDVHVGDTGTILSSGNASATGTPDQFFIKHVNGGVAIGNLRGDINFTNGSLKNDGNLIWDAGDFTSTNISNWNTAYGWGDHSTQGYLTSYNNEYVTGASWNNSTAVLTFTRNDGDTFSVTLLDTLSDVTVTGGTYDSGTQTLELTKNDGSTISVSGFAIDTDINYYLTGSTFNSSDGVLTLKVKGSSDVTVDLDGRYINLSGGTITRTSTHVAQGSISASNAHLDLYNDWESDTDQKGSILTFTDNYYDGGTYRKTLRSAIKGGTDTTGNTADGYLEFYVDSAGANSPNLVLRLDRNKNAHFSGTITTTSNGSSSNWKQAYDWGDHASAGYLTSYNNEYTTGATFNSSNGIITFTRNDGDTFTVDLDGRYLTSYSETDTLDSVVARGNTTARGITLGSGAPWTPLVINASAGEGTANAGVAIALDGTDYAEYGYRFKANGSNYYQVLYNGSSINWKHYSSGYSTKMSLSNGGNLTLTGTISASGYNDSNWNTAYGWGDHSQVGYLTSYNNEYTTGATFNSGNGIITFTRNDGDTFTVDIDGRFLTSYTETDTLATVTARGASTSTEVSFNGAVNLNSTVRLNPNGTNFEIDTDATDRVLFSFNKSGTRNWSLRSEGGNLNFYRDSGTGSIQISGNNIATQSWVTSQNYLTSYNNEYTTGATFNTGNGIITFTRNDGDTFSVDIDGRFLTSYTETDTLNTVTSRGSTTSNSISVGDFQASHQSAQDATTKAEMLSMAVAKFKPHSTNSGTLAIAQVDGGNSVGLQFTNGAGTADWDMALQPFGGNVGINKINPSGALHVYSGTSERFLISGDVHVQGSTDLNINGTSRRFSFTSGTGTIRTTTANALYLQTNSTTAVTIDANQNVAITGTLSASGYNKTNWDTAYGWGDHSQAGYLTSYSETDTLQSVTNRGSSTTNDLTISKSSAIINMGYQGGPHGINFYDDSSGNNDLRWGFYYRTSPDTITFETGGSSAKFTLDTSGNLTLTGTLSASGYNKTNWDTAYGWGDHSQAGYLTTYNDEYVTGASWNSSTAVLTFTRNDGDTFNVTLLDTLSDVTVTGGTYNSGTQTLTLTKSDGNTVSVSGFAIDTDVNYYTTGATFNTGNGVITGTLNNGDTWTVGIDGRYLTSYTETDTLQSVTDRGANTTNAIGSDLFRGYTYSANSFLDFDDDNGIGKTNTTTLASVGDINFIIDSNNNGTDAFNFIYGSTNPQSGTTLATLDATQLSVNGAITASGKGTFDNLELTSGARHLTFTQSSDDWFIYNDQQDNGIVLYNGTGGVEIHYNGSSMADFDSNGITLRSSVSTTSTLDVAGWATVGSLLVSNTAPYIDLVDTNSFTDANDRFRIRAAGNVGQIKWYDDSAGADSLLMTFNPDGTIGVEGDIDMGTNTITDTKVGQWDTAYGWGDHDGLYAAASHNHDSRYYTETEIDTQNTTLNETLAHLRGWVPGYSNSDDGSVRWNRTEDALELQSSSDTATGAVYKARRVEAGETIRFTVMVKGSSAGTAGLYLRIYQHDGNLPDGKTHVSNDAGGVYVQEDDRGDTGWYENDAIATTWTTHVREYTAPVDGYVSLVVLNWTSIGNGSVYLKTPDIQTTQSPNSNKLDGLDSSQFLRSDAADSLTATITMSTQKAFVASNYGHGVYGTYSASKYQHVWSMGTSYNLPADGDSSGNGGNLYGLAWSYNPDYGYVGSNTQSKNGLNHQLLLMMNGVTHTALGSGIWTDGTITTTNHGDSSQWNTAYGWGDHGAEGYWTSHADTSTLSGQYGGANNGVVIEDITVDSNGHVTAVGTRDLDGRFAGLTSTNTLTGGNKITIQNQTDGTSARGIFMWDDTDSNWGIYMATAGGAKSLADGTAASGLDGRTEHAIRFRVNDSASQIGFLWENANEVALAQITADTGHLYTRGDIHSGGAVYVGGGGGYFYNDSGSRVRINQDFYTNNSNTYLYANNLYLGNSSGDNVLVRGNQIYGNNWSISTAGYGTFTGGKSNGVWTVNSTSDAQILLQSADSWTGIGFDDSASAGSDYIWHWGATGTFAIGGGGSSVSGKKLHIDGGTTIGSSLDAVAAPTDGLYVQSYLSVGAPSNAIPLEVHGSTSGSTVFDVQGTQGQLFSITDDLSGDLFEVSDISGIPILTVNASGTVTIDDTLHVTGDVIAYYSSDERLKDNVKPIENAIDKIRMISGYEFDWNSSSKNEGHDIGVIAQEVEKILPEVVTTRSNGYKAVRYEKLTALLIQSNKELIEKVEELEKKLNNK